MKFVLPFLLLFCGGAFAEVEKCPMKNLVDYDYTDIDCQFYLGTKAYRHELYGVAAAHWQFVVDSPEKFEGDEKFKAMALSTLTFLTYNGLGVSQDRSKAVKLWKQAVQQGGFEARRHLGVAYSDNKFRHKNLITALGWYQSIVIMTPDANKLSDADSEIYKDTLEEIAILKGQLDKNAQQKALELAKSTLQPVKK